MQLREEARPMSDDEFRSWMDRQSSLNWRSGDGRPDSSPGLIWWIMLAVGLSLIGFAAGVYGVLS